MGNKRHQAALEILEGTTALDDSDYVIPAEPKRFLCVEMSDDCVVWAGGTDSLENAATFFEGSDTSRTFELVHDLDTGEIHRPVFKVVLWFHWGWAHPQTDLHRAACADCMMAHDKALPNG